MRPSSSLGVQPRPATRDPPTAPAPLLEQHLFRHFGVIPTPALRRWLGMTARPTRLLSFTRHCMTEHRAQLQLGIRQQRAELDHPSAAFGCAHQLRRASRPGLRCRADSQAAVPQHRRPVHQRLLGPAAPGHQPVIAKSKKKLTCLLNPAGLKPPVHCCRRRSDKW